MKPDLMSSDLHERAQRLIALSGPQQVLDYKVSNNEEVSTAERSWLAAHIESCPSCRKFAETSGETIRSLRAISVVAGASLVSTTRTRVRQRAQELQRRRERLRVIWVCSAAVTLCTTFNTAILWRGLAWMGQQARLSAPLFELGFVALGLMPAIVAGIILLARGTYMADHNGSFQG